MIKSETRNRICIVKPEVSRITASNALQFKESMNALVEAGQNMLILDMTAVEFVDSSGLGALVAVLKKIGNRGELVIAGPSNNVAQMFKITRMDRVFGVFQTPELAENHLLVQV